MTSLLGLSPVIPVVVVADVDTAVPMARALVAGGLQAIEVTMRTPAALDAVARIVTEVPDAVVGVGTVVSGAQVDAAVAAGARFLVSPGCTDSLLGAMRGSGIPFLPGAATASEVLQLLELGITELKFFPAEPAGGAGYLKALAGPLPFVRFCPTGGITPGNVATYLALPNVACVGGTWLAPPAALETGDWAGIQQRAAWAAALGPATGLAG